MSQSGLKMQSLRTSKHFGSPCPEIVNIWKVDVMHICGAKFHERCFNISRDIVYSVFYHF